MVHFVYQPQADIEKQAQAAIQNLQQVREELIAQIRSAKNTKALMELEQGLNYIFTNQRMEKMSQKIFDNLSFTADKALAEMAPNSKQLSVRYKQGTDSAKLLNETRSKYYDAIAKNEKLMKAGKDIIVSSSDLKAMSAKIKSLQVPLNRITGAMFENLLQMAVPVISGVAADKSGEIIDKQIDAILKGISTETRAKKSIKTMGSEHIKLDFMIDDDKVHWSGTGKIDVRAKSPLFDETAEVLDISAKSYSSLTNITLLTGKVLPLIASWPAATAQTQNYFYNALRFQSPGEYLQHTRLIFGIQSLIGIDPRGDRAGVLITYIRNRTTNPIVVHSIAQLVADITQSGGKISKGAESILATFTPTLPLSAHQKPQDFSAAAQKLTIHTQLNKQYLALEYLRKARS